MSGPASNLTTLTLHPMGAFTGKRSKIMLAAYRDATLTPHPVHEEQFIPPPPR